MQLGPVYRRLAEAGLRLTPQRNAILEVFADRRAEWLSAEDVWKAIGSERHRPVGLATVYRTLDLLAQLSVLLREPGDDGRGRHRLNPHVFQGRYELVCVRCGELAEVEAEWVDRLADRIAAETGFRVWEQDLKVFGVCGDCARASEGEVLA